MVPRKNPSAMLNEHFPFIKSCPYLSLWKYHRLFSLSMLRLMERC